MSTRLRYTPRAFVVHPQHKTLAIAEGDYGAIPAAEREDLKDMMAGEDGLQGVEFDEERAAQEDQFGAPKVPPTSSVPLMYMCWMGPVVLYCRCSACMPTYALGKRYAYPNT